MADDPTEEKDDAEAAEATEEGAEAAEGDGEVDGEEIAVKKRFNLNRKNLLMFGVPALLLLGGGGYFGASMLGLLPSGSGPAQTQANAQLYYDLPEMVVNLSSGDKRVQYLKLKVSLETSDQLALDALTPVMPRVLDMFQLYLRELRSTDLEGSAGIFRLKEELLRRINLEIQPNRVDRVLFKEIIVQ